jgi:hypothetical protein
MTNNSEEFWESVMKTVRHDPVDAAQRYQLAVDPPPGQPFDETMTFISAREEGKYNEYQEYVYRRQLPDGSWTGWYSFECREWLWREWEQKASAMRNRAEGTW